MFHRDHKFVPPIFLFHRITETCFHIVLLLFVIFPRNDHVKDQIDPVLSVHDAEIMKTACRVGFFHHLISVLADLKHFRILCLDRIHMYDKKDSQFLHRIPLDPVDHFVGRLDIHIVRDFRVDRRHTPVRTVIVNDQIMGSLDAIIFFHKMLDLLVDFRIHRLADQRLQRVFRDPDSCPHDNKRNANTHDPVYIDPCQRK